MQGDASHPRRSCELTRPRAASSPPERIGAGESEQLGTRVEAAWPTASDRLDSSVFGENTRGNEVMQRRTGRLRRDVELGGDNLER